MDPPPKPTRRRAREVEEELRIHLALRAEDNVCAEMGPAEADALARFGDIEHITAACLWAAQAHPLREAQRLLVTGLILVVGRGAFATALSLACAVLIRPLRFTDADRLVRSGTAWKDAFTPYVIFETWQVESTSFTSLTAFHRVHPLRGGGAREGSGYARR